MEDYFKLLRKYLSCCANCGSLLPYEAHLCKPCLGHLKSHELEAPVYDHGFYVYSLYRWKSGQSDLLSRLIISLKGRGGKVAWKYLANLFVRNNFALLSQIHQIYFVPAPSSEVNGDHSQLWAESLAALVGGTVIPCLRKIKSQKQRALGRDERSLIELEVYEKNTFEFTPEDQSLWIFVDDIVTTGATARAAHKALGKPDNFMVWALAQRQLSCGESRNLL